MIPLASLMIDLKSWRTVSLDMSVSRLSMSALLFRNRMTIFSPNFPGAQRGVLSFKFSRIFHLVCAPLGNIHLPCFSVCRELNVQISAAHVALHDAIRPLPLYSSRLGSTWMSDTPDLAHESEFWLQLSGFCCPSFPLKGLMLLLQ